MQQVLMSSLGEAAQHVRPAGQSADVWQTVWKKLPHPAAQAVPPAPRQQMESVQSSGPSHFTASSVPAHIDSQDASPLGMMQHSNVGSVQNFSPSPIPQWTLPS
jgi:hypothetical protein